MRSVYFPIPRSTSRMKGTEKGGEKLILVVGQWDGVGGLKGGFEAQRDLHRAVRCSPPIAI